VLSEPGGHGHAAGTSHRAELVAVVEIGMTATGAPPTGAGVFTGAGEADVTEQIGSRSKTPGRTFDGQPFEPGFAERELVGFARSISTTDLRWRDGRISHGQRGLITPVLDNDEVDTTT
jgi:hypothetical protein